MITKRKNRYVLVESSTPIDERHFGEISGKLHSLLGSFGQLDASPRIVAQYSPNLVAIRVNRGFEGDVILALAFVKSVGGSRTGLYTLKTSGTLRSLLDYSIAQFGKESITNRALGKK